VSFSLYCLVSATLPLILFKEKRREIWTDTCKKTVHVERRTVDQLSWIDTLVYLSKGVDV